MVCMALPLPSSPKRLSLSTWAVHEWLGGSYPDAPESSFEGTFVSQLGMLADLPIELSKRGILNLEVCHFHLRPELLRPLVDHCAPYGVVFRQLLIDGGDISHPQHGERDRLWIEQWVRAAGVAGIERARVIAGKSTENGAFDRAVQAMRSILNVAQDAGVRIVFENWFPLMEAPEAVHALHNSLNDHFGKGSEDPSAVGLCFDFGNWSGTDKYERLEQIALLAESSHAKCAFHGGKPDVKDFTRCMDILAGVPFDGPFTIVHGEPGRVWESIDEQIGLIRPYLS